MSGDAGVSVDTGPQSVDTAPRADAPVAVTGTDASRPAVDTSPLKALLDPSAKEGSAHSGLGALAANKFGPGANETRFLNPTNTGEPGPAAVRPEYGPGANESRFLNTAASAEPESGTGAIPTPSVRPESGPGANEARFLNTTSSAEPDPSAEHSPADGGAPQPDATRTPGLPMTEAQRQAYNAPENADARAAIGAKALESFGVRPQTESPTTAPDSSPKPETTAPVDGAVDANAEGPKTPEQIQAEQRILRDETVAKLKSDNPDLDLRDPALQKELAEAEADSSGEKFRDLQKSGETINEANKALAENQDLRQQAEKTMEALNGEQAKALAESLGIPLKELQEHILKGMGEKATKDAKKGTEADQKKMALWKKILLALLVAVAVPVLASGLVIAKAGNALQEG